MLISRKVITTTSVKNIETKVQVKVATIRIKIITTIMVAMLAAAMEVLRNYPHLTGR